MAARTLLLVALWTLPLAAQQASSADATITRAAADVAAAGRGLLAAPCAFTGSCHFADEPDQFGADAKAIRFQGAWQDGISLLRLQPHTVLRHLDRQLVTVDGDTWTLPQGDSPDLPFSPRMLARHLPSATLDAVEPAFVDDRPAMRAHGVWTGAAASALLRDAFFPQSLAQRLLERLADIVPEHPEERTCVDAAIWFDPASKTLRAMTLRIALLDEEERHPDDEPQEVPAGLPLPPRHCLLQFVFTAQLVPLTEVPWPRLDDTMRERLALPQPAAAPVTPEPGSVGHGKRFVGW